MQDSALLPSYKKLIEDGYYEEAYHVLNAIRRRYRHIKGLQLFCDNELKQLPKKAASKNQYFYFKQLPKSSEKSSNFLSFKREDSEHDWYFNEELRSLLEAAWSTESQNSFSLPSCVRRILVIGQETESKLETFKPISHILNFLFWHGGYTIKSLGFKKDISNQAISIGLNSADIVIINDISQIANNHELANTIASPKFKIPVILLVDEKNQFVDNLMQDNSSTLHKVLPYLNIFACYATQKELIEKYGTPKNFYVIGRPIMNFIRRPSKSMRGEKKKTVTIYGSDQMNGKDNFFYQILKDPRSKYYSFKQVRSRHYEDKILQRDFESNNNHDDDHKLDLIARTDIFCLSSDDDDIRLEAIDAYLGGSKLLLPKNTSLRAIFRNLSGIIFYNKLCHNELLNCLDALNDIDYPCIEDIQIVKGKVGLRTFCSKFVKSISDIYRSKEFSRTAAAISELYSHNGNKKICAATHLHDINLLFKLRRHCESLPKTQTSVFVTLEDGKNNSNYKNKIEKIFAGFNDVNIIFIKSHEPDITVFTYI